MSKEELIEKWRRLLEFKSSMVKELPESEWERYAIMFEEAEEKHKDNMNLLICLIPQLRRSGQYPEDLKHMRSTHEFGVDV